MFPGDDTAEPEPDMPPRKSKEPSPTDNGTMPTDYERRELGRKIHKRLIEKGWNQSDLAAELFGREVDDRGRNVAKGRDLVSKWARGASMPGAYNVTRLAKALDMEATDLAARFSSAPVDRRQSDREVKGAPGRPDKAMLTIYQHVMSWEKAMRIMVILNEPDEK